MTREPEKKPQSIVYAPFQLERITIPQFAFNGIPLIDVGDEALAFAWEVGARAFPIRKEPGKLRAELALKLTATFEYKSDTPTNVIEAATIGEFVFELDDEDSAAIRERFFWMLYRNGAAFLYGNLRTVIRSMVLDAGFREILIPSIDMVRTFEDLKFEPDAWSFPEE